MDKGIALELVEHELGIALVKFPPMNSAHEGFAILKEEVDELWDEVKKKPSDRLALDLRDEAKQVAAMAIRFMMECT